MRTAAAKTLMNNEEKESTEKRGIDARVLAAIVILARTMTVITTTSKKINNTKLRENHK